MLQESAKTALLTKPALTATTFSLKTKKKKMQTAAQRLNSVYLCGISKQSTTQSMEERNDVTSSVTVIA